MKMIQSMGMRDAVGKILVELGEDIENLIVITADVGLSTRAVMFGEKFRDRYFNVGIAKQHLIGFTTGLALAGTIHIATVFAELIL